MSARTSEPSIDLHSSRQILWSSHWLPTCSVHVACKTSDQPCGHGERNGPNAGRETLLPTYRFRLAACSRSAMCSFVILCCGGGRSPLTSGGWTVFRIFIAVPCLTNQNCQYPLPVPI